MNDDFYGKPLKFWIILGSLGIFLIIAVSFVIRFSVYQLSISGVEDYSISSVDASDKARRDVTQLFGYYLIPRSADFLEVTGQRATTRTALNDKPILGVGKKEILISRQKIVDKLGRQSLGCTIINDTGHYTYNCFSPEVINRLSDLDARQWHNSLERRIDNPELHVATSQYRDGLLIATPVFDDGRTGSRLQLEYIAPGTTETQSTTIDFAYTLSQPIHLLTDTGGGSNLAVINTETGDIYYSESLDSDGKTTSRRAAYQSASDTAICSLSGTQLTCYYGELAVAPDSEEETADRDQARAGRRNHAGTIETYQFQDGSSQLSYIADRGLDRLCVGANDAIIGLQGADVLRIQPVADKPVKTAVLSDDGTQISCGDRILYSNTKGVYLLDGTTSRLVFSTERHDISRLSAFGNELLFNTFVTPEEGGVSDQVAHTYRIDLSEEIAGTRLEDKLPYSLTSDLPLFDMDYTHRTIYIKPSFSIISDHATGQVIPDEYSFNQSKSLIEQRLRQDDIITNNIEVVYSTE